MILKMPTKNNFITFCTILVLAIITASLFNSIFFKSINTNTYSSQFKITADNGTIIACTEKENTMNYSFSQLSTAIIKNEGWEKKEVTVDGIKYNAYVANNTTSKVSNITFNLPILPQTRIPFLTTENSNIVNFTYDGAGKIVFKSTEIATLVTSLELKTQEINKVKTLYFYPFQYNRTAFISSFKKLAGFYSITTLLFFLIYLLLYRLLIFQKIKNKLFMGQNKVYLFVIFILVSFVYFLFILNTGKIANLGTSLACDSNYYRFPQIFNEQGKLSLQYYAHHIYLFRGYATQLLPIVYRILIAPLVVSVGINSDVGLYYFYFIFISTAIAFLFAYILPGIFEMLTKRKTYNIQIVMCYILFMFFWGNTVGYIMSDFPAAFFFITSIYLLIKFFKTFHFTTIFFAGITSCLSVLYRSSFIILIYLMILIFIVMIIIKLLKKLKRFKIKSLPFIKQKIVKLIALSITYIIAIYIIAIPQIAINNRVIDNHSYVIPHNGILSKSNVLWGYNLTLLEIDLTTSLTDMYFYKQVYNPSSIGQTLKTSIYQNDKYLNKYEYVYIAASNPLEFVSYIATKAFVAFDLKTNTMMEYSGANTQALFNKMLSLLNYILIGTLLYVFINKRYRESVIGKKHMVILSGIFILLCCPLFLLHIEWRYFISYYILLYYIICFPVLGKYLEKKTVPQKLKNGNFLIFIAIFILLSFTISNTLSYSLRF